MGSRGETSPWIPRILGAGVLLVLLALLFAEAMCRDLIHDEHQFVAPAAVLVQKGWLPYRDYPYFHTPYLAWIYGAVFLFTDHLLLGARAVSVAASFGTASLLFLFGWRALSASSGASAWARLGLAASCAGLYVFSPITRQASGMTWNHDGSTFLVVLGVLALVRGLRAERGSGWFFLAGAAISASVGVRLSTAPLVAPALLAAALFAAPEVRRRALASVVLGMAAGALPLLVLFAIEPGRFWFGNFVYPRMSTTVYREAIAAGEFGDAAVPMDLADKLPYFARAFTGRIGNASLAILFGVSLLARGAWRAPGRALLLVLLFLPFLLAGAWAPSPTQPQYFLILIPFLLIAWCAAASTWGSSRRAATALALSSAVFLLLSVLNGHRPYMRALAKLSHPEDWATTLVHRTGEEIASHVPGGLVHTTAPIYALEGKLDVYPQFVVGPFSLRSAHLLTAEQRERHGITSKAELGALLAAHPPNAVLPAQAAVTSQVSRFVRDHGFRRVVLVNGDTLWFEER